MVNKKHKSSIDRARAATDAEIIHKMLVHARKLAVVGETIDRVGCNPDMLQKAGVVLAKESKAFFAYAARLEMRGKDIFADSGQQFVAGIIGEGSRSDDHKSEKIES